MLGCQRSVNNGQSEHIKNNGVDTLSLTLQGLPGTHRRDVMILHTISLQIYKSLR